MFLSFSALITIVIICNISIIAVWFFLKKHRRILQISISTLIVGILLLLLRMLMPIEFVFQQTFGERHILPKLFSVFYSPIFKYMTFNIYVYQILLFIWIIGIGYSAIKTIISYLKFKSLIKKEPVINDEKVYEVLKHTERLYGKNANFKVIKTSLVSVPLFLGLFEPKIILPNTELSDQELNYILRHEAMHYYHHDLWIKLFTEIISVIYWWNPLVYILKYEIDKMLEIRVDMAVTKHYSDTEKINYLECLLKIARENAPTRLSNFALSFDSQTTSVLSQRFHIVLDNNVEKKSAIKTSIMFIIVVIVLMLTSFIVIEPYSIAPEDAQKTVELTIETAYLVVNPRGGYDIYFNDEYFGTVTTIKDSYSDLPIYKNIKEELNNEEN